MAAARRDDARALLVGVLVLVTAFEGLRAGAGTFRALLDLPARHPLGPSAFAALCRATDLSTTGIVFYAVYGIGGAALTGLALGLAVRARADRTVRVACAVSFGCSIAVLVLTTQAAPLMWQVGRTDDAVVLARLLDAFALWTDARIALADVSFVAMLVAMRTVALRGPDPGPSAPASSPRLHGNDYDRAA